MAKNKNTDYTERLIRQHFRQHESEGVISAQYSPGQQKLFVNLGDWAETEEVDALRQLAREAGVSLEMENEVGNGWFDNQADDLIKIADVDPIVSELLGEFGEGDVPRLASAEELQAMSKQAAAAQPLLLDHEPWQLLFTETGLEKAADTQEPVVAVDIDNTLAEPYDSYEADTIPPPKAGAKQFLEKIRDELGAKILVHTVRKDESLIKDWFNEHDLPFDFIHHSPSQPEDSSDKVFADAYVDDKAVSAAQDFDAAFSDLQELLKEAAEEGLDSPLRCRGAAASNVLSKAGIVKQEGGKWKLYTKDGKRVLGTHESGQAAHKQEYAIQKSQERRGKD